MLMMKHRGRISHGESIRGAMKKGGGSGLTGNGGRCGMSTTRRRSSSSSSGTRGLSGLKPDLKSFGSRTTYFLADTLNEACPR